MQYPYLLESLLPIALGPSCDQEAFSAIYDLPAPKMWQINIYYQDYDLSDCITVPVTRVRVDIGPDYGNFAARQVVSYDASMIPYHNGQFCFMSSIYLPGVRTYTGVLAHLGYTPILPPN